MAVKKKAVISAETKAALSALDWAVKHLQPDGRLPGEFTAVEFLEKSSKTNPDLTEYAVRSILKRAVAKGQIVKRLGKVGGHRVNFYNLPQ